MEDDAKPLLQWCDTHCHLDAMELQSEFDSMMARSLAAGVTRWIVPAVALSGFEQVLDLSERFEGLWFALGIHPLYVQSAKPNHVDVLEQWITRHRANQQLFAVGEIGLDLYPGHPPFEVQLAFFDAQLRLAKRYDLPVIVHARRAADQVFAALRRFQIRKGIVHAFNGSEQQAHALISQGMMLGFGGSLSFEGSKRIRRLAQTLPLTSMLLETDAPDIRPSWFGADSHRPNEPAELPNIAACLSKLRGVSEVELSTVFAANLERLKRSL